MLTELLGISGRMDLLVLESRALADNPIGNASRRECPVYLPPGYHFSETDQRKNRAEDGRDATVAAVGARFPVLYYLPSYASEARAVVAPRAWEENIVQRIDRLIRSGEMPPAIVVFVDGWTRLGGSQYVDSAQNGNFAEFCAVELTAAVDARYRTRPDARAVVGKSSGGFGALHLIRAHPGVFGACGSLSGDAYFQYAAVPAFIEARRALAGSETLGSFVEKFERSEHRSSRDFQGIMILAYAAAYSPASQDPWAIDLPFSLTTGEISDNVFRRWLEFDPCESVGKPDHAGAYQTLRFCYLDCGENDEYGLDVATRLIAARMRDLGVPTEHHEYVGGHRGGANRYDTALPALLRAIS